MHIIISENKTLEFKMRQCTLEIGAFEMFLELFTEISFPMFSIAHAHVLVAGSFMEICP